MYIINMKTYTASFSAFSALIECLQWRKYNTCNVYVFAHIRGSCTSSGLMVNDSLEPILFHYGERICPERVKQKVIMYTSMDTIIRAWSGISTERNIHTCTHTMQ